MDAAPPTVGIMATDLKFLWKWRKYLLLLATLVASVTYEAGLNPPGGVRSDDAPPLPAAYPDRVGDPVLLTTNERRYTVFFYCNAAAFIASLVVIMFLLDRRISDNSVGLTVLRSAMLVDLLALMSAFAAGSCRDVAASAYVSALFALVFACVAVHVLVHKAREKEASATSRADKFLLLLATFATPLTYGAGLVPPGGFWSQTEAGHLAGAPLLHDGPYKMRYNPRPVCVVVELLGLMVAFDAGSCMMVDTTVYVVCLAAAVLLLNIVLQAVAMYTFKELHGNEPQQPDANGNPAPGNADSGEVHGETTITVENGEVDEKVEESRSLLLLLATLAATVTYQAGLSPPGGVWPDNHDPGHPEHVPGNPILLDMHPKRYKVFYYCNTTAFVSSVVIIIIIIVQSKELSSPAAIRRAGLKTFMILNLFGLMGAYVAGSFRDAPTTIYVFSLAVAVFAYSIVKVVTYTHGQSMLMGWMRRMSDKLAKLVRLSDGLPRSEPEGSEEDCKKFERWRQFLLQLAIFVATVTYQIGLNPPGGFWPESKHEGSLVAGDPVLLDHYGLYKQGIRSNALRVCVTVGLLGLMGAYAAGSCRQLRTSIYVFALVAAVVVFLFMQILLFLSAESVHCSELPWLPSRLTGSFQPLSSPPRWLAGKKDDDEQYAKRKYLMLLGILGASVTYQAGLAPPGGTWGDDDTSPSPALSPSPSASPPSVTGNPILLQSNPARYQAFFYCNATSFMASIVVTMLLLQYTVKKKHGAPLWALQAFVVLDLFGLLGAYAAGSCRDMETLAYVIAFVGTVVVFIAIYACIAIYPLLSFEAVRGRAKELRVCKYFSRVIEKWLWRPLGVSNGTLGVGNGDQSAAATGASV
uniref:PGG domain-containing protein n=1 Tax=Hordeum vulgare subsp. vulgare TaxID=112509 RepID=A0A8I7BD74_HORVV